jgi:hypothetical protein
VTVDELVVQWGIYSVEPQRPLSLWRETPPFSQAADFLTPEIIRPMTPLGGRKSPDSDEHNLKKSWLRGQTIAWLNLDLSSALMKPLHTELWRVQPGTLDFHPRKVLGLTCQLSHKL